MTYCGARVRLRERPRLTRNRALVVAAAGTLVAGLTVGPSMATSATQDPSTRASDPMSWGQGAGTGRGRNQTSDGKPGIVVGPPVDGRGRAATTLNDYSYEIAPGVVLREWDQVDGRQPVGQVRMNLLSINLDAPNITLRGAVPEVRHEAQHGQPARPLEQRHRRGQR